MYKYQREGGREMQLDENLLKKYKHDANQELELNPPV
jgi:hypothetical protein